MRILTLNTWQESGPWQERWEVIFEGLKVLRPDVVGFQEVFNADWAGQIQKRTGLPFLIFRSEPSGLMILSRFPVEASETLTLKTHAASEPYLRYVLYGRLAVGSRSLAVFNTHLSWQPHEGAARQNQVHELLDFVQARAADCEALALGDFNAPPETPEIRLMKSPGSFADSFAELHPGTAGLTWDNRNTFTAGHATFLPDRRIDYIFHKQAADREFPAPGPVATRLRPRVLSRLFGAEIVLNRPSRAGVYASDHFGVLATFESGL